MVFWANRVASFQTTITLKRTAGEVVAGTQRIAKKLILEEVNNLAQSLTDFEADDSSNTLDNDGALPSDSIRSRLSVPDEPHKCSPWATSPFTGIDILDAEENRPLASPLPRRHYLQVSDITTGDDNATNRIQTDHQDAHPEAEQQASDLAHSDDSLDLEEIDDLVALIASIKHKKDDKGPCWHIRFLEPHRQDDEDLHQAQGNKPDRPDFKVMIGEKEVSFGEVTGPTQRNDKKKSGWDLYRLSRFGTAVLNEGALVVPLIQVVADVGTVYRHFVKARGIMVLAEVGVFSVPTATIHMGALLASLPTLFRYRNCIKWLEDHPDSLKRS
ncbi:hypothetical protein BGZ47_010833 [Haplosporangium gracile]|nr:hypothetical protein BGZ47_010833 [Haplosporangium gracile]